MPAPTFDRVRETTTVTSTGTMTLLGAVSGYQAFSVVGNGATVSYCIEHRTANEWEVGTGVFTSSGTTLSRVAILASSNAGAAVSFSAGTKDVYLVAPAAKLDGGVLVVVGTSSTTTGTITLPDWAAWVEIEGVAAGGGGGSGRVGATSTARNGGNGGNGGSYGKMLYRVVDLGVQTIYYSVGAWGTAGAAVGTVASNGNSGGSGGTLYLNKTSSGGVTIFGLTGGLGGLGGTNTTTANTPNDPSSGQIIGGLGGQSGSTGAVAPLDVWRAAVGGGYGVCRNPSNVDVGGSTAGRQTLTLGAAIPANSVIGGGQAGGSGGLTAGAAGADGANYGGGGGGGGYNTTGSSSGGGGHGGPGILVVRWW